MMPSIYDALLTLRAHLSAITIANGYPINVHAVAIHRDALAVGSDDSLPMITLFLQRDEFDRAPTEQQNDIEASTPFQHYRRVLELEGFVDVSEDSWELALEELLTSVRLALRRYPDPLRMTPPQFFPPEQNVASFTLTLSIPYEVNLSMLR